MNTDKNRKKVTFSEAEQAVDRFFGRGTMQRLLDKQGVERPKDEDEVIWSVGL